MFKGEKDRVVEYPSSCSTVVIFMRSSSKRAMPSTFQFILTVPNPSTPFKSLNMHSMLKIVPL